jgi:hypothetical protein
MKEIRRGLRWIRGYVGRYAVSDEGYVISFVGKVPRVLKGGLSALGGVGYRRVKLVDENGITRQLLVHILVANAFLGHRPRPKKGQKIEVNHINKDRLDNRLANLEWVTSAKNREHSYEEMRRFSYAKKLSKREAAEVKYLRTVLNQHLQDIAEQYGVSFWTVWRIAKGRSHKDVMPFPPKRPVAFETGSPASATASGKEPA